MSDSKTTSDKLITGAGNEPGGSILGHIWASIGATIVLGIICCGIYPLVIWAIGQTIFPHQANGSLVKKDGTYTTKDEEAVGSSLIGQNFSLPGYFHPRPSAAGAGYDATSSGGTNLGPLSAKFINGTTKPTTLPATQPGGAPLNSVAPDNDGIRFRVIQYCLDNGIKYEPADALAAYVDKDGNPDEVKLINTFNDSSSNFAFKPLQEIPGDAVTASGSGLDPHISPLNATLQTHRVAAARNISDDKVAALIKEHTDGPDLGFLGDPGVNVLMLNLALDAKYPLPAPPATAPAAAPVTQPVTLPTTEPAGK